MTNELQEFINKPYTFKDNVVLEILQIKTRDENIDWVTYQTIQPGALPRKQVMPVKEFIDKFGHLYGLSSIPDNPV